MKKILLNFLSLAFLFNIIQTTYATTLNEDIAYYIDATNGSDENDGSDGSPWKTLSFALSQITSGTHHDLYVQGTFTDKSLSVIGTNDNRYDFSIKKWNEDAIFQGDGNGQFMRIEHSSASFDHLTIKDYGLEDNGGAVYLQWSASLDIESCNFINNQAKYNASKVTSGGAIFSAGTLTVNNSYFGENYAETRGGAIFISFKDFVMKNSLVYMNSTNGGGWDQGAAIAIYSNKNNYTNVTMTNNSIVANYSNLETGGASGVLFKKNNATHINILDFSNNISFNYIWPHSQSTQHDLKFTTDDIYNENFKNNIFSTMNAPSLVIKDDNGNQQLTKFEIENEDGSKTNVTVGDQLAFGEIAQNTEGVYYLPITKGSYAIDGGADNDMLDIVGSPIVGTAKDIGQFEFTGAPATISMNSEAEYTYDGTEVTPTFTIQDEDGNDITDMVALTVTYNGSVEKPMNAGEYTIIASLDVAASGYNAILETTLTIHKAEGEITLNSEDLMTTYDGEVKVVNATSDYTYQVSYQKEGEEPTDVAPMYAGTYTVTASINDTNYEGQDTQTLTIEKATVTLEETMASKVYNTQAQDYGFVVKDIDDNDVSEMVAVDITYNGETGAPTNANDYAVVVTVNDMNYKADAALESIFTISKATAEFTVGENLALEYNGQVQMPELSVSPEVAYETVITGVENNEGIIVGEYNVVATVSDDNYEGSADVDYSIVKATAIITFGNLEHTNDGQAKAATYTVKDAEGNPLEVMVDVVYTLNEGVVEMPTATGNYVVTATVNDQNYKGEATADFVITDKMEAIIMISEENNVYNGEAQDVAYTITNAEGTAIEVDQVMITYNELETVPMNAGTYTVMIKITDNMYVGEATAEYTIEQQMVTITEVDTDFVYNSEVQQPAFTLSVEDLNTTVEQTSGNGMDAGDHQITVTIAEDNYKGTQVIDYAIAKANVDVVLSGLSHTYDQVEKEATVTLGMEGLSYTVTYNDAETLPINAGENAVKVMITEDNYMGNAEGILVIEKAEVAVTVTDLSVDYDGEAKEVEVTTAMEVANVIVTYNDATEAPIEAGTYEVVATIEDPNYMGSGEGTLTIVAEEPTSVRDDLMELSVYPNPSQGQFSVQLTNAQDAQLSVHTLAGQEVYTTTISKFAKVTLPSNIHGVVIVKIASDNQVTAQKVLIK